MTKYLVRRALWLPLTIFASIVVTFIFVRMLPGDPFFLNEKTPKSFRDEQNHLNNLDLPLPVQFGIFFTRVIRLDFGNSYFSKRPVAGLIWEHFLVSIIIISIAFVLMVSIGLGLGIYTGRKQKTWIDHALNGLAVFFTSVPTFVFAAIVYAVGRWITITFMLYEAPVGGWGNPERGIPPSFVQIIFPALILSLRPAATIMRMTYTQYVEVTDQDYVRTAYSKGLANSRVSRTHIFRNSLIPVASVIGNLLGIMLIGVAEVEIIFKIPGLGSYFINSILTLDFPVVVGATCFYTFLIAVVNLLVDWVYVILDPRISYTRTTG